MMDRRVERMLRIDQRVVVGLIVLLSFFAVLRADWIFDTYADDDRVCSEIVTDPETNRRECSIELLLDELDRVSGYTLVFVSSQSNVQRCRETTGDQNLCVPVPEQLKGKMVDPMLTTGYATVFFGLWVSIWLEPLFRRMSAQLRRDAIIEWSEEDEYQIDLWRLRLSYGVTLVVSLAVFIGFTYSHFGGLPDNRREWEFLVSAVILAGLCGHRLGTAAALGRVGRLAMRRGSTVRLILGHADGMGGAKRLGEFLAYQGVLISIPIAWLTVWILLIWSAPDIYSGVSHWIWLHTVLLLISVLISVFSFIRPLYDFSGHYRQARSAANALWNDKSRSELLRLQNQNAHADWQDMRDAIERSTQTTEVSETLAALPTVPLRRSVQGIFSISTLFPIAAFLLELSFKSGSQELAFISTILKIISGLLGP